MKLCSRTINSPEKYSYLINNQHWRVFFSFKPVFNHYATLSVILSKHTFRKKTFKTLLLTLTVALKPKPFESDAIFSVSTSLPDQRWIGWLKFFIYVFIFICFECILFILYSILEQFIRLNYISLNLVFLV